MFKRGGGSKAVDEGEQEDKVVRHPVVECSLKPRTELACACNSQADRGIHSEIAVTQIFGSFHTHTN